MLWKCQGLSDHDLRRRPSPPSSLTMLGLVKHLAYVERWWFQDVFAGRECSYPWTDEDPDADFRIEPNETTQEILDLYKAEGETSNQIVAGASLDDMAKRPERSHYSLRRILVHMVEETARHTGHADILREQIDGATGDH